MGTVIFPINTFFGFLTTRLADSGYLFELKSNQGEIDASTREILGFKATFQNWRDKIDAFTKLGYTGTDLLSVFSSKNKGEPSEFFLMSRIDFKIQKPAMIGQIEFFSEMKGTRFFREITMASFRVKGHSMVEISYSWEEGTKIHGHSLWEFVKNPEVFIKKRF